ncbi:hypothetical protein CGZ69_34350 [Streptomyces peucetius subsp. caesius ATCC 27952]|nr:hypothetical protein CGZ69_34350 [Streptomyces peucetius subsp. caesius ATCC 27952]
MDDESVAQLQGGPEGFLRLVDQVGRWFGPMADEPRLHDARPNADAQRDCPGDRPLPGCGR